MIRDSIRAALAALVLWPMMPPRPVPVAPAPVTWQAPPPVAWQSPPAYNPPPSRLRAAVARALDAADRLAPF